MLRLLFSRHKIYCVNHFLQCKLTRPTFLPSEREEAERKKEKKKENGESEQLHESALKTRRKRKGRNDKR